MTGGPRERVAVVEHVADLEEDQERREQDRERLSDAYDPVAAGAREEPRREREGERRGRRSPTRAS
jgi:hypothetical protein